MKRLHISRRMSGKMEGVNSLSSSCLNNPFCQMYMKHEEFICPECFAAGTQNRYKNLKDNCLDNGAMLQYKFTDEEIMMNAIDIANTASPFFRIESFGDTQSVTHAFNYMKLIIKASAINSELHFGWWSKNIMIHMIPAFKLLTEKEKKIFRKRCSVVVSSFIKDKELPEAFVDKIESELGMKVLQFIVMTYDNGKINCGSRRCLSCTRCYLKKYHTRKIYELIK